MDAHRTDALLRSLSIVPSRRGLLALLTGVALGSPLTADAKKGSKRKKKKVKVCHQGKTIKVRKSARKSHLRHGDTAGACPPPIDAGCPGPADVSIFSRPTPFAQFAQTFLASRSGVLTAARCEVGSFVDGADFTLEIVPVDPLTGLPTEDVLASVSFPDLPSPVGNVPLAATFTPPVPVQAGDPYALVVTMIAEPNFAFTILARQGNPCPGILFFREIDESLQTAVGRRMVFSATIV